jgi:uncharacterized protein (TIGR02679 family)
MTALRDVRLQRLLGGDHLAPLRKRLRKRFERGPLSGNVDRFRISNLTTDEHAALASLLGRSVRFSGSMQVDVLAVNASLKRAGIAVSLRQALEEIDGPILHTETLRRELEAAWSKVVADCVHPGLAEFLNMPAGIGLVKRLSQSNPQSAARLCCDVESVLRYLPANGMTRAQLAADALGDAHALDNGRPVTTIVLAVWRDVVAPLQEFEDLQPVFPDGGNVQRKIIDERARNVWARAGVLVNELARPALLLNLPVKDNLRGVHDPGEPSYASLRFLLRTPSAWAVAGRDVFVCENPNVLAIAADQLGERCAPMVCTEGMPAAAQRTVLNQLAHAGARLHYHGDFDWPGLRIGNHVVREYGARPWRFGAAEYIAAVQSAARPGRALSGAETVSMWDEALTPAMQMHRLVIAEESVASSLLQDLQG